MGAIQPDQQFGYWTVLEQVSIGRRGKWRCVCKCGTVAEVRADSLKTGGSLSCGCLRKENGFKAHYKHGSPREFLIWVSMRSRCNNPNTSNYHLYGGRGVQICEQWNSFENFIADMGYCPSGKHSIDRYPDKNGNYEPFNCRWATQAEQIRNRRSTVFLTVDGVTLPAMEWYERMSPPVAYITVYSRVKRGWDHKEALTIPPLFG